MHNYLNDMDSRTQQIQKDYNDLALRYKELQRQLTAKLSNPVNSQLIKGSNTTEITKEVSNTNVEGTDNNNKVEVVINNNITDTINLLTITNNSLTLLQQAIDNSTTNSSVTLEVVKNYSVDSETKYLSVIYLLYAILGLHILMIILIIMQYGRE